VGATRSRVFSKEWSQSKEVSQLKETHKKEIGSEFPKSGYVRKSLTDILLCFLYCPVHDNNAHTY